jgi:site-specific DNA recombinase
MRTILYARYSSELQSAQSTIDQLATLAERAAREGWDVVATFADDEFSGRAGIGELQRPGLNAMLERVERGDVDQVLAEATDRIARHIGDAHAVREHLEFFGARLFTLADGLVDDITGAIKGLMDARFLKDLADRVRRGQRGQHSRGFNTGGRAYGYRVVKPVGPDGEIIRGILEINEDEAAIVRRIYSEILADMSAYAIVKRLNAEGVPSPSGKKWRVSTLHGDRVRANGILRNPLYRGEMIYNRTHKVYHHKTRRRVVRSNPLSEWRHMDAPQLRIVTEADWFAVERRYLAFDGVIASQQRRSKHLLSGLGKCGLCGGNWIVLGTNRWGCTNHKSRIGCANTRSISTRLFETRVLGDLKALMLDTPAVEHFIAHYNAAMARKLAAANSARAPLERKIEEAKRRLGRIADAIADGAGEFQEFKDRLRSARDEIDSLQRQLDGLVEGALLPSAPDLGERYRGYVASLDAALSSEGPARARAIAAIRSMIDVIALSPSETGRGVDIRVEGRMAEIINLASHAEAVC